MAPTGVGPCSRQITPWVAKSRCPNGLTCCVGPPMSTGSFDPCARSFSGLCKTKPRGPRDQSRARAGSLVRGWAGLLWNSVFQVVYWGRSIGDFGLGHPQVSSGMSGSLVFRDLGFSKGFSKGSGFS